MEATGVFFADFFVEALGLAVDFGVLGLAGDLAADLRADYFAGVAFGVDFFGLYLAEAILLAGFSS